MLWGVDRQRAPYRQMRMSNRERHVLFCAVMAEIKRQSAEPTEPASYLVELRALLDRLAD